MFFEGNKNGIFSFNVKKNWKYVSVWKSSNNWFAFGVHIICDEGIYSELILCSSNFVRNKNICRYRQ